MKVAKVLTFFNYLFTVILWLSAILVLIFNGFGYWDLWNLSGYAFGLALPAVAFFNIFALAFSCVKDVRRLIEANTFTLIISVAVTIFTVLVSMTWFW
jgi:hypothetical protein